MSAVTALGIAIDVLRRFFLGALIVLAVIAAIDWAVRTRRINPFSGVARFFRRSVHPLVTPVERAVVRAGGLPSSAPWWSLLALIVIGVVALALLGFVRDQLAVISAASGLGLRSVLEVVIGWIIGFLTLALFIRVFASLVRASLWSKWLRWTVVVTEPLLAPIRRVLPPVGMFDLSPLVAWLVLVVIHWILLWLLGVALR